MRKYYSLTAVILIFTCQNIRAETARAPALTLKEIVEQAKKNNPEIAAAKKRWETFQTKIRSEKTLNKPVLGYEQMYSGNEKNFTIAQEFPFPGKLYAKGNIARKEAHMAEQVYRAKEKEVLAEVKSAYAMYFLSIKSLELFKENVELMKHFSKTAESKYAVGKANQTDVLRAQVELSKMLTMLVTFNQEIETARAMLNMLLNLEPNHPLGMPEEPQTKNINFADKNLQSIAQENRPELLETYHHVHHSNAMLRSARLEVLPDIMAQYRYRTAMDPAMDKTQDIMAGFSIPLWFGKQQAMVQTAKKEVEMAQNEYQAMKNRTFYEIKNLAVKVQTAERLVQLYKTSVIPQAESALKSMESAYQSDKVSFLELLDVQRNLLQFHLEYFEQLAEYEQRLADLERVIGKEISEANL